MTRNRVDHTYDYATILKDAGLVAASAAATVAAAAKILDLGAADVRLNGKVVVDVTALEIASNDEIYDIIVQVSSSATFASVIKNVGSLHLAATEVADGGADDGVVGHYEIPFTNEINGTAYRYVRLYTKVAGTVATGINYSAHLAVQA